MKSDAERGRYGAWLRRARLAAGYDSVRDALAAMAREGIELSYSVLGEYEAGTKVPSRAHMPLLERFYGPVPDEELHDEGVVAAIKEQTAVLRSIRQLLAGRALDPDLQRWAAEQRAAGTQKPAPKRTRPRQGPARTEASR